MWNSGNSLGIGSTALFQRLSSLCQCHLIPSPGGFCVFHLLAGTSSCSAQQSLGKLEVWQSQEQPRQKNSIFWAKTPYSGQKTSMFQAKNLHVLGKKTSMFWAKNPPYSGKKPPYSGEKTSIFWEKTLHILGKKPPYSGKNVGSGICGGPGWG